MVTDCENCHSITESPLYMFWSFGPTFATQNEIMYHSSGRGVTREAISIYQGDDIVAEITEVKQMSTTTTNTGETGTTTTTTKLVTSTPKITITNAKTITGTVIFELGFFIGNQTQLYNPQLIFYYK